MVVILGYFHFGQDRRARGEAAVVAAAKNATAWVVAGGYANVIVEIANEIDLPCYTHQILKPDRAHELIEMVQQSSAGRQSGRRAPGRYQLSRRLDSSGPTSSASRTSSLSTATMSMTRPRSV
jgi:hypothetical protein